MLNWDADTSNIILIYVKLHTSKTSNHTTYVIYYTFSEWDFPLTFLHKGLQLNKNYFFLFFLFLFSSISDQFVESAIFLAALKSAFTSFPKFSHSGFLQIKVF